MKKIISLVLIMLCAGLVFAQSDDEVTTVNETESGVSFGAGLTPGLTDLGFCNYFDKTASTLGAAGSISTPFYNGGLGAGFGLNGSFISADTFHKFTVGDIFQFANFDYVTFNYKNKFQPENVYFGNIAKVTPFAKDSFLKSVYATAEYLGTAQFETIDFTSTVGLETYLPSDNYSYLLVEPYAFMSGYDFDDLNAGLGIDVKSCIILAKYLGLSENVTTRYALANFAGNKPYSHLCVEDYYRGTKRNEMEQAQLVFSSSSEIFFNSPDINWTLLNFLTFVNIQAGPFFTTTYNNEWAWSTGGFTRFRVSMGGGNPFFGELGYGYNSVTTKGFFIVGLATAY